MREALTEKYWKRKNASKEFLVLLETPRIYKLPEYVLMQ